MRYDLVAAGTDGSERARVTEEVAVAVARAAGGDILFVWGHRDESGKALWIVLGVIGMIVVIAGGDVGFNMVFRMGVRVEAREARRGRPADGTEDMAGTPEAGAVAPASSTPWKETPPTS